MNEKYFNKYSGDLETGSDDEIEIRSLEHADQLFEEGMISSEQHLEYKSGYYVELMKEEQQLQRSLGEMAVNNYDKGCRVDSEQEGLERLSTSQLLSYIEYNQREIVDLEKQDDKIFDQNDANPAFRGGNDPRIIDIRSQIAKLEAENKKIQEILDRR